MTYSDEKHIDYIIEHFNFERVYNFMKFDNWTWTTGRYKKGVEFQPTLNELKSTALKLLMDVKDGKFGEYSSTGGFTATKSYDSLKLDFSIVDISSDWLNLGVKYVKDKKQKDRKEKLEVINGLST